MQNFNASIQSSAIDVLQAILARGDVDTVIMESIEAITIGKLYFSIHTVRLDLQDKWLHLLHSVLSTSHLENRHPADNDVEMRLESAIVNNKTADQTIRYSMNPLLTQTLMDGISTRSNRPVLQHWLDFILMAVPQFQPALQAVVSPLNDCLCRQILLSLSGLLEAACRIDDYVDDKSAIASDAELVMLLNGLERLILLSLAYTPETYSSEDDPNVTGKPTESTGLLGYVSTVFNSDASTSNQSEQLTVSELPYRVSSTVMSLT